MKKKSLQKLKEEKKMLNEKDCVVQGVDYEEKPRKKSVLRNGSTNGVAKKILLPLKKSEKNTAYSSDDDVETDLFEDDEVENDQDSKQETRTYQDDFDDDLDLLEDEILNDETYEVVHDELDDLNDLEVEMPEQQISSGIYKAIVANVKRIDGNEKIKITFSLLDYKFDVYANAYIKARNSYEFIVRLATCLETTKPKEFLGRKLIVSVKVNETSSGVYHNVIDVYPYESDISFLEVNEKGYFIR